jgi:hypothetical protein
MEGQVGAANLRTDNISIQMHTTSSSLTSEDVANQPLMLNWRTIRLKHWSVILKPLGRI